MRDTRLRRGQMALCAAVSLFVMGMSLLAPAHSFAQGGRSFGLRRSSPFGVGSIRVAVVVVSGVI